MAIVWKIITIYAIFSLLRFVVSLLRSKVRFAIYTANNAHTGTQPHKENSSTAVEAEYRVLSEE